MSAYTIANRAALIRAHAYSMRVAEDRIRAAREAVEPLVREALGRMNLSEVARRAGVSVAFVSEIKLGHKRPSAKVCDAVAQMLEGA